MGDYVVNRSLSVPGLRLAVILLLVGLAVLAYVPAQFLPLISDDYEQISVSRRYGPVANWDDLLRDPLYRCRSVSIVMTWWLEKLVGFWPPAFNVLSLLLHVVNTLLVAAFGLWPRVGWRISVPAAAFFAVAEGHQEAVIWYAAVPELNVFFFAATGFLAWVLWLEREDSRLYAVSLAAFVLALFSKESGVAVVGAQALAVLLVNARRIRFWGGLLPFLLLSALYFIWGYSARSSHLHYNDGTFSLSAPFLLTLLNSIGRMFWFWGLLAVVVLVATLRRTGIRFVLAALAFSAAALLPYSFLLYMPRVPSRHTYLASAALAMVVGYAYVQLSSRLSRRWMTAIAAAVIVHNCGYLWFYKQGQFLERAMPTVALIETLKSSDGQIVVECFPYAKTLAEQAARIAAGTSERRLIFRDPEDCRGGWRYTPLAQVTEASWEKPGQ
jgi:hypothetical protein